MVRNVPAGRSAHSVEVLEGIRMLHLKRPARLAATVLVIAALGATAACSGATTGGQAVATGQSAATTSAAPAPVAVVTASPALGDQQLSPTEPVTIKVDKGTIATLQVTNPEGAP